MTTFSVSPVNNAYESASVVDLNSPADILILPPVDSYSVVSDDICFPPSITISVLSPAVAIPQLEVTETTELTSEYDSHKDSRMCLIVGEIQS